MASYSSELLTTAKMLLVRDPGSRGRLPDARVRRCISTTYYALFHFLLEEAGKRLVGTDNFLRVRRRTLTRNFTHAGLRTTFNKIRGPNVDQSIEDFLRGANAAPGPVASPAFARNLAHVFLDARTKREDADYDRNEDLSASDAAALIGRVGDVIRDWDAATTLAARDFKHGLYLLMLVKGQLRRDDPQ
jgi:hypothetical protein